MGATGGPDCSFVAAEEGFDIAQMLVQGDFVSLPLVMLLPLIVIVKNQRYDIVETVDKAIGCSSCYEPVKLAVELGKVMVSGINIGQEFHVSVP